MEENVNVPAVVVNQETINGKMTSKEIADLTGKQHPHVMRDIKKLISDNAISADSNRSKLGSVKTVSYKDAKGETREMYELDFKATMTLVTGYDAKRRAVIINRWIALETGEATPAFQMVQDKPISLMIINKETKAAIELAKLYGIEGNQALLSANRAVNEFYGVDGLALLDIKGLENKSKVQYFTPSTLGNKIEMSAVKFNQTLKDAGLQVEERDHKKRLVWHVTAKGKPYCQIIDTGRKHGNGSPVTQIHWSEDVLSIISTEYKAA